jgi:hypothetical protein
MAMLRVSSGSAVQALSISRFAFYPNGQAKKLGTKSAGLRCAGVRGRSLMTDQANAPENLTKLAEEAKLVAETTQDPNRRRMLRMMSLKYKRLAKFARAHPDERRSDGESRD